jgi:hypothetical protein
MQLDVSGAVPDRKQNEGLPDDCERPRCLDSDCENVESAIAWKGRSQVEAGEVVCGLLKHDWRATKWGISGAVAKGL